MGMALVNNSLTLERRDDWSIERLGQLFYLPSCTDRSASNGNDWTVLDKCLDTKSDVMIADVVGKC